MSQSKPRNARRFKLDPEQVAEPPHPISAGDPAAKNTLAPFETPEIEKPLVPRSLKRGLAGIALLLSALIVNDIVQLVNSLWSTHWLLGASVALVISAIFIWSIINISRWMRGGKGMSQMHQLQRLAAQLSVKTSIGESQEFKRKLQSFYAGKIQEGRLNAALDSLANYANDAETIDHLERVFVAPLDAQVDKIIQRYSLQTGLSVAASPFPTLDVLLTLWRCQIMITEVSAIYGIKPNITNRFRILYQVLRAMAYSGLTETSIGLADLSNIPLGQISARTAQGLGAAVAAARLGTVAAQLCRPIPAKDGNEGLFKKLSSAVLVLLGKRILRKTD